jgi:hypothetical protein
MILTAFLVGFSMSGWQGPVRPRFFDDLLHWRQQFESALKAPADIGYTHVYTELLGGAHGDAFYPIGSAGERYMVSFNEGDSGDLIYEKRIRGTPIVVWHVRLVPSKKKTAVHGTMLLYLKTMDLAISSRSKLTTAARKQLSKVGYFAGYSYHPEMGGYAWVVKPDGSRLPTTRHRDMYTITAQERKLLTSKS